MTFFAHAFSLFLIMNSLGNVPLFIGLLSKYTPKKQRRIIMRELLIALLILVLFMFFGDNILKLIGISQPVIGIAGGTLLFIIALGMIFPHYNEMHDSPRAQEPYIVPLAMPIIAGPGSIATVMVYAEQVGSWWMMLAILLAAWLPSLVILLASANIKYILGQKGLLACQKFGGMLISLIAVQMICSGILSLLHTAFPHAA